MPHKGARHCRWTDSETDFIKMPAADWWSCKAIAKYLGRSHRSVSGQAEKYGIALKPPMSGDHELRMHLPTELWQRLRTFADEMSMSPRVAGRVIIVAVLRDSWLLGNVRQPSMYVEKDGRAEAP
jgi:hypothetical protein